MGKKTQGVFYYLMLLALLLLYVVLAIGMFVMMVKLAKWAWYL